MFRAIALTLRVGLAFAAAHYEPNSTRGDGACLFTSAQAETEGAGRSSEFSKTVVCNWEQFFVCAYPHSSDSGQIVGFGVKEAM
jgi:hypothetical protein